MGPGLIIGASDDDPSGIATYSQAGAQFDYSLGWTLLFNYPLMCAIQLISAQIMGEFALQPLLKALGWLAAAAMSVAAVGMFATWGS